MFALENDTIVAPATAVGSGAIAIIRLSGKNSFDIINKIVEFKKGKIDKNQANTIKYGIIKDNQEVLDDVLVSIFANPKSYTGEDSIEISCHSSKYIVDRILQLIIKNGARIANAGEFTQRAFLNGKLDLAQAEAVADVIASQNKLSHSLAIKQLRGGFSSEFERIREQLLELCSLVELELDFSEEDVEFANREKLKELISHLSQRFSNLCHSFKIGNAIKEGISVAIVGSTNSGKSTLLNCLLQEDRAIVSDIEGTTRDSIEEYITIDGVGFRFIDTAGLRQTNDSIEKIGIAKSYEKLNKSFIALAVLDGNKDFSILEKELKLILDSINLEEQKLIVLVNKIDIQGFKEKEEGLKSKLKEVLNKDIKIISISSKNNFGIDMLKSSLIEEANIDLLSSEELIITNARHYQALEQAKNNLDKVKEALDNQVPTEFLAEDLRLVLSDIGSITGQELISPDEILGSIFSSFCIGK